MTGLEPGKTYEWQILTRDGDLRTAGQFQSASTATGTAPDVNANACGNASPRAGVQAIPATAKSRSIALQRTGNLHLTPPMRLSKTPMASTRKAPPVYPFSSQAPGTVPLYRMTGGNGDTVLTIDGNERGSMQTHGYRDAGIAGYVSSSQASGTQPLYRLSNANGDAHFFTTSASERQQFLSQGFKDEGTVGYVWSQQ